MHGWERKGREPKGRGGEGREQGGPREKTGCDGISSETSADLTGSSGAGMVQIWGTGIWLLNPCIDQLLDEGY